MNEPTDVPDLDAVGLDHGPLFTTPQIHTDQDGVHTDDDGRRYVAEDVDGELTFVAAEADDEVVADAACW